MIPRYSVPELAEIWSDRYKFDLWREIEVLYCEGMARFGLIPKGAAKVIRKRAAYDIRRMQRIEKKIRHDVVAFLTDMSERIGPEGKYLHMGMTSSDLLDTAAACQMREAGRAILKRLRRLRTVLKRQALRYRYTPMVGRTHGMHAEPTTFGLKILVWYAEAERNIFRLERAVEEISVGKITGAVGTMATVDGRVESFVMKRMGLGTSPVTTQVIQRDRYAYFLATLAVIGSSIEKAATEIRALQRTEIGEVEEPFTRGQKGSSAMPHKRNPIVCERISGMARLLRSNSIAAMENVALWHERDISHSSVERVILPDSTMLLAYMVERFAWVMEGLGVDKKAMKRNMESTGGLIFSQRLLLLLVGKNLRRESAYVLVQKAAMKSLRTGKSFREIVEGDTRIGEHCSPEEIEDLFDSESHLRKVDLIFRKVLAGKAGSGKGRKVPRGGR